MGGRVSRLAAAFAAILMLMAGSCAQQGAPQQKTALQQKLDACKSICQKALLSKLSDADKSLFKQCMAVTDCVDVLGEVPTH